MWKKAVCVSQISWKWPNFEGKTKKSTQKKAQILVVSWINQINRHTCQSCWTTTMRSLLVGWECVKTFVTSFISTWNLTGVWVVLVDSFGCWCKRLLVKWTNLDCLCGSYASALGKVMALHNSFYGWRLTAGAEEDPPADPLGNYRFFLQENSLL